MKRILALLFALILILPSTAIGVEAAGESVIYVCDSGSDTNNGATAETAMKNTINILMKMKK